MNFVLFSLILIMSILFKLNCENIFSNHSHLNTNELSRAIINNKRNGSIKCQKGYVLDHEGECIKEFQ